MKNIDARGLSCPQPMLMAKKAMESGEHDTIEVLVDCEASIENINRAAGQLKWDIQILPADGGATLELVKK